MSLEDCGGFFSAHVQWDDGMNILSFSYVNTTSGAGGTGRNPGDDLLYRPGHWDPQGWVSKGLGFEFKSCSCRPGILHLFSVSLTPSFYF